jgi:nucleoside-diphosphate-sugar epimerase
MQEGHENRMPDIQGTRILITGGTGFLGGAVARHLAAHGAQVTILVRSPEKAQLVQAAGFSAARGDITNRESVRRAVDGCTYVVHCAAAFGKPDEQRDVNINGTRILAEECAFAGVRQMVHISSIAVYGFARRGIVDEIVQPVPGAYSYARTKLGGENAIRETAMHTGLNATIIRPGMIYGPGSSNWTLKLFRYARRKPIFFPGDGSGSAHPIYIDDVVSAVARVTGDETLSGAIFNISADPAPTWREWLLTYAALAGHQSWVSVPPLVARTGAGLLMSFAGRASLIRDLPELVDQFMEKVTYSTAKARRDLGWAAQISLQEGVERCAPWLREKGLL